MQEKINPKLLMLLLCAMAVTSVFGFVLVAGYILLKSVDDDLKAKTIELVWYFSVYYLAVVVLGLIPDLINTIDGISFIEINRSVIDFFTGPMRFLLSVADIGFKCFVLVKAAPYLKK